MKRVIILLSIFILVICTDKEKDYITIPNDSIRIRVIANSNNLEDQVLKLKVKDNVENILYKELKNVKTIEKAREKIKKSIPKLEKNIEETINNDNYDINYGLNYFPQKEMYGIEYSEGNYESLVINIGEAKGNNWWCVLFPPICMIDIEDNNKNKVEYKSKVLEIIKEYS